MMIQWTLTQLRHNTTCQNQTMTTYTPIRPAAGLYPTPPGSPTSQPITSESAPGTPPRREEVYHNLFMTPPYSPPNNPPQVVSGVPISEFTDTADIHTCPSSCSPMLPQSASAGGSIYNYPLPMPASTASNRYDGASILIGTAEVFDSPEKIYSEDDAYIIIEMTKRIQENPQSFCERMNSLFPKETKSEMLTTLASDGQVLELHKIIKEKFERMGKRLTLRRFNRLFTSWCEEQMQ